MLDVNQILAALPLLPTDQLHRVITCGQHILAARPLTPSSERRQQHRKLCPQGGRLLFGYRRVEEYVEIDEVAAQTVHRIDTLRRQGMSLRGIAALLNEERVPTAQQGNSWGPSSVREVLTHRPSYCGQDGWPIILGRIDGELSDNSSRQDAEQAAEHSNIAEQVGERDCSEKRNASTEADMLATVENNDALLLQKIRMELHKRWSRRVPMLITQLHDPALQADCQQAYEARRALGQKRGGLAARLISQIHHTALRSDREAELADLRRQDRDRQQVKRKQEA